MANLGGGLKVEETEYESESEKSVCAMATRRENASDDDDDYGNCIGEARERLVRSDRRFRIGYEDESDGLGGFDDDDAVSCFDEPQVLGDEQAEVEEDFGENDCEERSYEIMKQRQEEESKAPVDPRDGAFYMHDDRFRGRGSSRWTLDERFRALRDERKWMHDMFQQMKVQETYDNKFNAFAEVRRISEQYHQGHPKNKGKGWGYVKANWSKTHDNLNNQNYSANVVRGRGPIKYNPIMRSSNVNLPTKAKQSMRTQSQTSNTSSSRVFSTKDVRYSKPLEMRSSPESARTFSTDKKSEKFGRDASINASVRKNNVQPGKAFGYFPTSELPNHTSFVPQYNSLLQGRIANNPIGRDKFYAESFIHPASERYPTNLPPQPSTAWPTYTIASSQMMSQRDLPFSTMLTHQLLPTTSQVSSVYPLAQQPTVQPIPVESTIQHPSLVFTQQLNQRSRSGLQASPEAFLQNSCGPGTPRSLPTSSKSKVGLGGKGISALHGYGRDSLLSAETLSNQNFTENEACFPAMQHGSQHNGDLGKPAVNRAVARYLSQPQNAFGNPEITWFPVFPAAAGTVGSKYHSSCVPAKGGCTAHSTEKSSSYCVTRYSRMKIDKRSE